MARPSLYEDRRDAILTAIEKRTHYNLGRPPTFREIASDTGCGLGTLHAYLQRMRDENLVTFPPGSRRAVRVTPGARSA